MSDTRQFIPLNVQKRLADLANEKVSKALGPMAPAARSSDAITEWVSDACCESTTLPPDVTTDFRVHPDRVSGNVVFRRFHDGKLDLDAARDVIMDVIIKQKNGVQPLTDFEKVILSAIFPYVFDYVDPVVAHKMAMHHLKISPEERTLIAVKVAAQMQQTMASLISGTGVSA